MAGNKVLVREAAVRGGVGQETGRRPKESVGLFFRRRQLFFGPYPEVSASWAEALALLEQAIEFTRFDQRLELFPSGDVLIPVNEDLRDKIDVAGSFEHGISVGGSDPGVGCSVVSDFVGRKRDVSAPKVIHSFVAQAADFGEIDFDLGRGVISHGVILYWGGILLWVARRLSTR